MSKGGQKKYLNRIIREGLRERKIIYANMMQATVDLANLFGIDITNMNIIESRAAVVNCLTGKTSPRVSNIVQEYNQRALQFKTKKKRIERTYPRPKILPGIPSASTLERDIKNFYASWEWKRLSYDVKLERGRVCECCGARPPKAVITTDHIKPIRRFWHLRFDRTNMQVLCDDCNRGKASHDETDFRSLNATESAYPIKPDMTPDEQARLDAIHDQLKLH